jgi:hypothetical protein
VLLIPKSFDQFGKKPINETPRCFCPKSRDQSWLDGSKISREPEQHGLIAQLCGPVHCSGVGYWDIRFLVCQALIWEGGSMPDLNGKAKEKNSKRKIRKISFEKEPWYEAMAARMTAARPGQPVPQVTTSPVSPLGKTSAE